MRKISNYLILLSLFGFLEIAAQECPSNVVVNINSTSCTSCASGYVPTYYSGNNPRIRKCISNNEGNNYNSGGGSGETLAQAEQRCGANRAVIRLQNGYSCGGCKSGFTSSGNSCVPETVDNGGSGSTSNYGQTECEQAGGLWRGGSCVDDVYDDGGGTNNTAGKTVSAYDQCIAEGNGEHLCEDLLGSTTDTTGNTNTTTTTTTTTTDGNTTTSVSEELTAEAKQEAKDAQDEICEEGEKGKETKKASLACKIGTPLARVIASGIMSGISGLVWGETNKEVHRIEKNISELEKVRDAILANKGNTFTACSESARDNPEDPRCYCYTASGVVNNNRDPQGICAALFPYYRAPVVGGTPTLQGCVNMQGQFDRDCQCRQQTRNGQNNCQKITKIPQLNLGAGALSEIGNAARSTNGLLGGNYSGASTYNPAGGRSLARLGKANVEKLLNKKKGTIDKAIGNQIKLLASNKKLQDIGAGANLNSAGLASIANGLPQSVKDNLDKKVKGIISKADKGYGSSRSPRRSRSSSNDEMDFEIGDSLSMDIDGLEDEEKIMAKNYNYGNSDVFQNSSASIFKLLSSRYRRSAYKRLFKEENIIQSDLKKVDK